MGPCWSSSEQADLLAYKRASALLHPVVAWLREPGSMLSGYKEGWKPNTILNIFVSFLSKTKLVLSYVKLCLWLWSCAILITFYCFIILILEIKREKMMTLIKSNLYIQSLSNLFGTPLHLNIYTVFVKSWQQHNAKIMPMSSLSEPAPLMIFLKRVTTVGVTTALDLYPHDF